MSEDPTVQHDEKDCTDQYFECVSECSTDDKECETVCVEDLKECDVPEWERIENPIYHNMTSEEDKFMQMDKGELISECLQIAALLGGTCERVETLNSTGRASKKIIIEYDVKTVELQS
tara:strand:- start:281 stop:637 length:357 start_codon:yes stop_codon:yes gene_type:complete